MENVKSINGIFVGKLRSIYNHEEDVYEKHIGNDIKQNKNQRIISVKCFRKKIGYRIICRTERYTFLKLYIAEINKTIKVDIRKYLETKFKKSVITKSFLSALISKISREIEVQFINGTWQIVNYEGLFIK